MLMAWVVLSAPATIAQDRGGRTELGLVSRIKLEAFDHSQVMDTLGYLTDVYGPRLTASPEFKEAADWTVARLKSYGVENARLEKWGPFGRSWGLKQYSIEMIAPRYAVLDAAPLAWSDATRGPVTAELLYAPYGSARGSFLPRKQQAELDQYMAAWKGKLKGKIVLLSRSRELTPITQAPFSRLTDKELSDGAAAPQPVAKLSDVANLEIPDDPDEEGKFFSQPSAGSAGAICGTAASGDCAARAVLSR